MIRVRVRVRVSIAVAVCGVCLVVFSLVTLPWAVCVSVREFDLL